MGGDGGSIPTRSDLIKTKRHRNPLQEQKQNARQLWSFCALSKLPLQSPIVSCPLGKLYNKEAIISFLLSPSTSSTPYGNDGILIASHIRSLKDLTTLTLTPNPSLSTATAAQELDASNNLGTQEEHRAALFVCPISLREMNGTVKFVYRKPCGCVMSESSMRKMRQLGAEGGVEVDTHVCPVDGARDDKEEEEWVTLNPTGEEAEEMNERWQARKLKEKEEKRAAKERKRKDGPSSTTTTTKDDKPSSSKKSKPSSSSLSTTAAPSVKAGSSVPLLSATLAAKLAEQKKAHSPAVASLYAKKGGDANHDADGRSNWMTRGAFTHYA